MARSIQTLTQATAGSTTWLPLSTRFETQKDSIPRSFSGSLVSGDTVTIELSNDEDPNTTPETSTAKDYTDTNFGETITGDWRWVRLTKTGANGTATIRITQ